MQSLRIVEQRHCFQTTSYSLRWLKLTQDMGHTLLTAAKPGTTQMHTNKTAPPAAVRPQQESLAAHNHVLEGGPARRRQVSEVLHVDTRALGPWGQR